MARIDAFIERLFGEGARELRLETGSGATLAGPRGPVVILRQPLTTPQIVGAFAEVAPADLRPGFPPPGITAFPYLAPAGPVDVRLEVDGDAARAVIVPRAGPRPDAEAATPPPPPPPPAPAAPPPPPPRAPPRISCPAEPRGALEALLEAMLARRASDLHLSSDSPPTFRIDGDIDRKIT